MQWRKIVFKLKYNDYFKLVYGPLSRIFKSVFFFIENVALEILPVELRQHFE